MASNFKLFLLNLVFDNISKLKSTQNIGIKHITIDDINKILYILDDCVLYF